MRKRKNSTKLFKRFFLSYLFILAIPLVILSYIVFGDILVSTEQEVLLNNVNLLNKIQNVIDTQIDQLNSTASQFYTSSGFKPFKFEENPLAAVKIPKELSNYNVVNSFVDEIFLYCRGDKYIHSSNGSMTLSFFINRIYIYDDWKESEFINTINNITSPVFRKSETIAIASNTDMIYKNYITYICPLPLNRTKSTATMIFHVPEESIMNLISKTANTDNITTIIADKENNILLKVGAAGWTDISELLNTIINTQGNYAQATQINDTEFLVSKTESPKYGFRYITIIPTSEVLFKVDYIKTKLFYGIVIILILSFIIILYSMRINYNPIKMLKQLSEEKLTGKSGLSEIETIHLAIEQLSNNNNHLNIKLSSNKLAIKDLLLKALLKGQIRSNIEFIQMASHIGITSSSPFCFSVVMNIFGYSNLPKNKSIEVLEYIEQCILKEFVGFACDNSGSIVLILLTNQEDMNMILNKLSPVQLVLKRNYDIRSYCAIGSVYNDITKVHLSYFEAYTTLKHFSFAEDCEVRHYSDFLNFIKKADFYPSKELEDLKQSISFGNHEIINCFSDKLLEYQKCNADPLYLYKHLSFELYNLLVEAIKLTPYQLPENEAHHLDVLSLTMMDSIETVSNQIKHQVLNIFSVVKDSMINKESLVNKLTAYINAKYDCQDFSIKVMAEEFNMKLSTISQYFKDHAGITISKYVTDLKFIKAKQILAESDMPLKDIVQAIGYCDVSSFIRKFKKEFGITPIEYRSQFTGEKIGTPT